MNGTAAQPGLRNILGAGRFVYGAELVTTRGPVVPASGAAILKLGEGFCESPRLSWISVTDNPGGNPMTPGDQVARCLQGRKEVVVHLTCKDMSRNGIESAAWRCASAGINGILALSGDYPANGHRGLSAPVFDLDSVSLISLLRDMNEGLKARTRLGNIEVLPKTDFFVGCAVSPFKKTEEELVPQYLKLLRKLKAGAQFVIPQLGYDMRKFHEVLLWLQMHGIRVPVIGNVYVLSRAVAGMFNRNVFPGCVVSGELVMQATKRAAGPDHGQAFFTELAAKQLAVFRGMGFAGGYLAGVTDAAQVEEIVALSESYGADDWKRLAKEIQFSHKDEFYLFEADPATGLGVAGRLNPGYLARKSRPPRTRHVTIEYRVCRATHANVFTPGKRLFNPMKRVYGLLDRRNDGWLATAAYGIEKISKFVWFGCRDCGDCSLPDCVYLCPMSACSKNQRNGPCGGSHDGICEVGTKTCIWVRAYARLRRWGEVESVFAAPVVTWNADLMGTSSWANTFLGRDHNTGSAMTAVQGVKRMPMPGLTIIGESINDSVPSTKKLYDANDLDGILALAKSQDEGGAAWIDVNVGRRPPSFMADMVRRVQSVTAKPISIDTPDPELTKAALEAYDQKRAGGKLPILNSISPLRMPMLDLYRVRPFMPILLVSERMEGGAGKPNRTVEETVATAREMLAAVKKSGLSIPNDQLIFDPGIGPIASDMEGMVRRVLESIRAIHADPVFAGCHLSVGLSNFSHMLPSKKADGTPVKSAIESAFLTRAMPYGLDFIIGSVKRRYEVLPEGHPALLCLDGAVKAAGEDALELVVAFYSE